jgi:hypothetical protein
MIANGQGKQPAKPTSKPTAPPASELTQLRDSYIKTTTEYKASLQKLLVLYQASEHKAEQRLAQSQELYKDALLSKPQLEESERAVTVEKGKVRGVEQQIATADTQIAQTLIEISKPENTPKLAREYKRASARQPTCRNWTLTASRRQRGRSVTVAFKLVCQD